MSHPPPSYDPLPVSILVAGLLSMFIGAGGCLGFPLFMAGCVMVPLGWGLSAVRSARHLREPSAHRWTDHGVTASPLALWLVVVATRTGWQPGAFDSEEGDRVCIGPGFPHERDWYLLRGRYAWTQGSPPESSYAPTGNWGLHEDSDNNLSFGPAHAHTTGWSTPAIQFHDRNDTVYYRVGPCTLPH